MQRLGKFFYIKNHPRHSRGAAGMAYAGGLQAIGR